MLESIIRAVVFVLLAISTTALSTASFVLKLRRPEKPEEDKLLQENSLEETDFYSSPLDHLLTESAGQKGSVNVQDRRTGGGLHLAAMNGDLVRTQAKARQVS